MNELRLERIRRWSHVSDLVGDVTGRSLSAVVSSTQSEPAPSVGRWGVVHHIVRRGTAVPRGCSVEVVPSVGGHTHAVGGGRGSGRVEFERTEVTRDVAGNGELVRRGVTVTERGSRLGTAGQDGVNAGGCVNTDRGPLVHGAVVHEDDVHAWAVSGTDLKVTVAVVVPKVLVELVGTGVHTVGARGRVDVSTSEPVAVEGTGAGVETRRTASAAAGSIELKEVLVRMAVVGQLSVEETGRVVVTACVDVRCEHGHLLVRGRCVDRVNDVELVRRRRGLRTGQGWVVPNVGTVATLIQVLVLPVVADIVADGGVRDTGLELTVGGRAAARTDGDGFTSVELVVGAQSVGGAAPGGAAVHRVEQLGGTAGGGVNSGHIGELDEEGSLTLNVRINTGVRDVIRRWGVGVRTTRVGDQEVGLAAS